MNCPGHGEYTHAELITSFGRCGACGEADPFEWDDTWGFVNLPDDD